MPTDAPLADAGITILGLGPGPYRALTLEAVEALSTASELYLRTARHPTVAELPATLRWTAFDDLYDAADSFDALYDRIVGILLERGRQAAVTYAVPGHPMIGEATVQRLLERATAVGVRTRVIAGLSFAEAALAAGGVAGVDNLQVVDALALPPLVPTAPLLVHQVYKPTVASDVKLALLRQYPPEHPVVVIRAAGTADETITHVALAALDRGIVYDHLTSVFVPALAPDQDSGSFPGLVHLVARLRRPGGCPWDAQQTHASLKRYLFEEAYEAAEAIDEGDDASLCDELGDLLLQVALHAEMADERGAFDVTDVVHSICAKLVRRHPHVFGTTEVADAAEVEQNWEAIKRRERGTSGAPVSRLDGLPRHHPALVTAQAVQKRLLATPPSVATSSAVQRWVLDAAQALSVADDGDERGERLGRLLFGLALLARLEGLDAEEALRQVNRHAIGRARAGEAAGSDLGELTPADVLALAEERAAENGQSAWSPAPALSDPAD